MTCPICRKPTQQNFRPFCSKRCADVDLARWFNGSYATPSRSEDDFEELEQAMHEALAKKNEQKPH